MLINDFSFTKAHLGVMVNQLKKGYQNGWDKLNISFTYDSRIRLTDDGFLDTEGFMVIGKKEYEDTVDKLGTDEVSLVTEDIYTKVNQHRGVKFQEWLQLQLEELHSTEFPLKKARVGDLEVLTYKDLTKHYRADRPLNLAFNDEEELEVIFRGKSVLYRGYHNRKMVYEEGFEVDEDGKCKRSLITVCQDMT